MKPFTPHPIWVQSGADYSWSLTDVLGDFIRTSKIITGDGVIGWVLAWTESNGGLRIGSHLYPSLEAAQQQAENVMAMPPRRRARA